MYVTCNREHLRSSDSRAWAGRLQTDDVILKVDGHKVTQDDVTTHVRGNNKTGTRVTLTVKRHSTGLVEDVVCMRAPSVFVEHTKDMYLLLESCRHGAGFSGGTSALVDKIENHLSKLEINHLALEDHMRGQIRNLEVELEEMVLICQDLLQNEQSPGRKAAQSSDPAGRAKDLDLQFLADRERLKANVAEERAKDLEDQLTHAFAEADRLRQMVSGLEDEQSDTTAAELAPAQLREEELRAQISTLEQQLVTAEDRLEASARALDHAQRQLRDAAHQSSIGMTESEAEGAMALIKRLRDKHMLQTQNQKGNKSTVGVVVEGLEISAIVPGGPLDRDFDGVRIEPRDTLVAVDGKLCDPDTLFEDLVGEDVVGSPVLIRIKQFANGRHVNVNVIRGSVARIQAIGELFLMFTEVLAAISAKKRVSPEEILRIEAQAKVVNEFSTSYLDSFRSHIHDLEEALIVAMSTQSQAQPLESQVQMQADADLIDALRKQVAELQTIAHNSDLRAHTLAEQMRMTKATHERERDEMRTKVDSSRAEHEIQVARLQLELTDAGKKTRTFESDLADATRRLRDAKAAQAAAEAVALESKSLANEASEKARAANEKARAAVASDMQLHRSAGELQEQLADCKV